MTKEQILIECFERMYKGLKFTKWESFKKSKQAQLLSNCYDLIEDTVLIQLDEISGKLMEAEREIYLLEKDEARLNWIESQIRPKDTYCEIFFAGLRNGHSDASEYQIESNPENFPVLKSASLRGAIDKAVECVGAK